jgi:Family of unknown function (DUF6161)
MPNETQANTEPILSFNLPQDRGPKKFYTVQEFETWLNEQRQWWQKIIQPGAQSTEAYQRWSNFDSSTRGSLGTISGQNSRPEQKTQALNQIKANVAQYTNGSILESDSVEGKIVGKYREQNPQLAFGFLGAISEPMANPQNRDAMYWSGFLLGSLHRVGMLKEAGVDRDHLASVEKEWRETLGKLRDDSFSANQESRSLLGDIRNQSESESAENKKQQKDLTDFCENTKKECNEWQDRFNKDSAFREPIEYWEKKEDEHRRASRVWGVAWLFAGVGSVASILRIVSPYLKPDAKIDYQHGALVLLLSGFAIWLMRILTRMFLSNVHQQSDAAQRKTMVQTYLALWAAQKVKDENQAIILEAMFRPVTMGVVKEDETPSHPFSITKLFADK